jgi:hypothetical protein
MPIKIWVPPFFLLPTAQCLLGGRCYPKIKKRQKEREGFKLDFLQVGGSRR